MNDCEGRSRSGVTPAAQLTEQEEVAMEILVMNASYNARRRLRGTSGKVVGIGGTHETTAFPMARRRSLA